MVRDGRAEGPAAVVTPAHRGFPRTARLTRPADFTRVYGRRQSAASGSLVVYALANGLPDGRVRLGLSVSRRIGGAVVRNRWKRRLREAFRTVRAELPPGVDTIVVVRSGRPPAGAAGHRQLTDAIASLVARIVKRPGFSAAGASGSGG
ncbi:ribonuclease P protein component [bacterium]|nr:ribonuclease P protein component [bacterium]